MMNDIVYVVFNVSVVDSVHRDLEKANSRFDELLMRYMIDIENSFDSDDLELDVDCDGCKMAQWLDPYYTWESVYNNLFVTKMVVE